MNEYDMRGCGAWTMSRMLNAVLGGQYILWLIFHLETVYDHIFGIYS